MKTITNTKFADSKFANTMKKVGREIKFAAKDPKAYFALGVALALPLVTSNLKGQELDSTSNIRKDNSAIFLQLNNTSSIESVLGTLDAKAKTPADTTKNQTAVDSTKKTQKVLEIGGAYDNTAIKPTATVDQLNFNGLDAFVKWKIDSQNVLSADGYFLQDGKTFSTDSTTFIGGASVNYVYTPIKTPAYGLEFETKAYWNNNAQLQNPNQAANAFGLTTSVSGYRPFMTPWTQSGLKINFGAEERKGAKKIAYGYSITPFLRFNTANVTISAGEGILFKQTGLTYNTKGINMAFVPDAQPYMQTVIDAQLKFSEDVSVSGNATVGINQQVFGVYLTTTVLDLVSTIGAESVNMATVNGQKITGLRFSYSAPVNW